jgi:bacterioferritin-associated ferredoxin
MDGYEIKNDYDNVVCFCSWISRHEIDIAVANGCDTIELVRNYLGKTNVGECDTKNPSGKCCHPEFLQAIKNAKNTLKNE